MEIKLMTGWTRWAAVGSSSGGLGGAWETNARCGWLDGRVTGKGACQARFPLPWQPSQRRLRAQKTLTRKKRDEETAACMQAHLRSRSRLAGNAYLPAYTYILCAEHPCR